MAEIPDRLIALFHVEMPSHLEGTHSLFRFDDQAHGYKPFDEGQMRVMEHRASGRAELVATILALVQTAGRDNDCPSLAFLVCACSRGRVRGELRDALHNAALEAAQAMRP